MTFIPPTGTSANITSLSLTDGADLFTNGFLLNVLGQTTIDGAGTTIRVDPNASPGTFGFTALDIDLNNGGALVEATVRMVDPNVSYKAVHASRGKAVRAEPDD